MKNLIEILKQCPSGMELDCSMYDNLYFDKVDETSIFPIITYTINNEVYNAIRFTETGCYNKHYTAKCVIFPKGKTTWEGFVPPCQFKDGDIVVTTLGNIAIIKEPTVEGLFYTYGLMLDNVFYKEDCVRVVVERLATEEEKQKLFDTIKANGYKWNAKTKTLKRLIEPSFKVGDRIRSKSGYIPTMTIIGIDVNCYQLENLMYVLIETQDNWELVPNKFDISTLKPFDKVLVRDTDNMAWFASLFSHIEGVQTYKYTVINGIGYAQCIPYEGNEHLLGTTNDCDEYYKTW